MEDAEKMLALKKAYADIILNTSKEAAARIMASERKALRFQQELCSAKDEAVQMLVRLKQMIDSKTIEAEITSLSQRRRIDELEAQLDEAEEKIIDLRTELQQAHYELDKVKNKYVGPLKGSVEKQDGSSNGSKMLQNVTSSDPMVFPTDSGPKAVITLEMKDVSFDARILDDKCSNSAKQTTLSKSQYENFCLEMYRNGCTQRIRALETNTLDEKLPSSGEIDDQHFLAKNETNNFFNEQKTGICTLPSPKTENTHVIKNPSGLVEVPVNSSGYEYRHVKVSKMRRRKFRYGKAKPASCKPRPCQLIKPRQPSAVLSRCRTYSCEKNDDANSINGTSSLPYVNGEKIESTNNCSGLEEKLQNNKVQVNGFVRRSLRKRRVKHWDGIATSCRSLSDQLTEPSQQCSFLSPLGTCSVNCNVKSGKDALNSEVEVKVTTEPDQFPGSMNLPVLTTVVEESGLTGNAIYMDAEFIGGPISLKEDYDASESPNILNCKSNFEMDNVSLMDDDGPKDTKISEATNKAPILADNSKPLKYTFSRKRKKECLTGPDENTSPGRSDMKKIALEKQNGALQLQNPSLVNESSRDSRRLAQVARQLISLSGKRW